MSEDNKGLEQPGNNVKESAGRIKTTIDRLFSLAKYATCILVILLLAVSVSAATPNNADQALKGEWKSTDGTSVLSFEKGKVTSFNVSKGSMFRGPYTTDTVELYGKELSRISWTYEESYGYETGKWSTMEKPSSRIFLYGFTDAGMLRMMNDKGTLFEFKRGTYLNDLIAKATADAKKAREFREMSADKAVKTVKGAKDAAEAFETISALLENGNTDAALASIEAAIPLLKKQKAAPERFFRYELTEDGSGVKILGPADGATFVGTLVFPDTIEGMPVKEIKWMKADTVTAVIVPEGVTYFGGFGGKALLYVSLPSTLKEVGSFSCKKLARIDIPENAPLENIPGNFASYTSLAQFKFPSAVKIIGKDAFAETKLTSVELPDGVEILGFYFTHDGGYVDYDTGMVFADCKELTSVKLPKGLKTVGGYCFGGCSNLTEVIVPEGMGKVEWKYGHVMGDIFEGTHLKLKSQAALKAIGYKGGF